MMDIVRLTTLYVFFALVATLFNMLSQEIMVFVYFGKFYIFVSVLVGTIIGLIVKYILDKKYIFKYKVENRKHDRKLFILYAVMGIFTTIIFWGFEFSFYYIFEDKNMRYVGGVIGLLIGYISKYFLDKKYVFKV